LSNAVHNYYVAKNHGYIRANGRFLPERGHIMVIRKDEMATAVNVNMRGGEGTVRVTKIVDKPQYDGNARLIATIHLEPGASIGAHIHENEEEIFYVISGEALYNDNGTDVVMYPGDSCICNNNTGHALKNNRSDSELVVMAIILTL
jgi:mannose-6-phosphate isomerase-like protein (cupin superfamily)